MLELCCDTILIVSPQDHRRPYSETSSTSSNSSGNSSNKIVRRYLASANIRALQGDLLGHAGLCLAAAHRLLLAAAPPSGGAAVDSTTNSDGNNELSLVRGCLSGLVALARGQDQALLAVSREHWNSQKGEDTGRGGEKSHGQARSQTRIPSAIAGQQVVASDAPPQWVSERALKHVMAFARQQLLLYLATANLFADGHENVATSNDASDGGSGGASASEGTKAVSSEVRSPSRGQSCEAAEALAMVALNALADLLDASSSGVASTVNADLTLAARVAVTTLLPLLAACAAVDLPTAVKEGSHIAPFHGGNGTASSYRLRRSVASIVRACEGAATVTALQQRANDAEKRAAAAEAALAASKGLSHAAAYQEGYATGFAF